MLDMLGYLLNYRHINNLEYIKSSIGAYLGIRYLIKDDEPLWIFSLNHDICIEILTSELNIPIKTGILQDTLKLPRRNKLGKIIGNLTFNIMDRENLILNKMDFFQKGEKGINLLKIHGSLDVFLYNNSGKYVKLLPSTLDTKGWLNALQQVNKELLSPELEGVKAMNEIAFEDYDGKIQFLRRTLLAGEYKFDQRITQNTPPELLKIFEQSLKNINELIIIGYGFNDIHINQLIEKWLNNSNNTITIVNPNIEKVPFLQKFKSQINIQTKTATEWMMFILFRSSIEKMLIKGKNNSQKIKLNKDKKYSVMGYCYLDK